MAPRITNAAAANVPQWKQLSDDKAEVKLDYFLHFPAAFSQLELCLTDEQYSFYWRLFHLMMKSGGFLPFDAGLLKDATKRRSLKTTEKLLTAMLELEEFEVIDYSQVPQNFRKFLRRNEMFFEKNPKILMNRRVFELVRHGMNLHETAVANGRAGGQKSGIMRRNGKAASSDSETEDMRDKKGRGIESSAGYEKTRDKKERGEEEKTIGDSAALAAPRPACPETASLRVNASAGKPEMQFGFAQFRDLWNEWAAHYGVEQFELLTDKKRKLFNTRQKHFAKYGAGTESFWVDLLSVIAVYRNGFYIGNNDGFNHDGKPWRVTFNWLFANDDNVEKFIKAVG